MTSQPEPASSSDTKKSIVQSVIGIVFAAFVFFVLLPNLVDYSEVFELLGDVGLAAATVVIGAGAATWILQGGVNVAVLPGLSLLKGMRSYLAPNAVNSTIVGPFDMLTRYGMYLTWGFGIDESTRAIFMSGLFNFYWKVTLPVIALGVGVALGAVEGTTAMVLAVIATVVLVGATVLLILCLKWVSVTEWLGRILSVIVNWALRLFRKPERDDVVDILLDFRLMLIDGLKGRWHLALGATGSVHVGVFTVLVVAMRVVGMGSDTLSIAEIFVAYAVTMLVTLVPITPGNVGVAEASYIAVMTMFAGDAYADEIAAGVFLFRIATWLVAIPTGWIVFFWWTHHEGRGHKLTTG